MSRPIPLVLDRPDPFLPISRHPYHINERVLFLYLGNALFAVYLSQKDIFDGAWGKSRWPADNVSNSGYSVAGWPTDQIVGLQASLGERLTKRVKRSMFFQFPLYATLHGVVFSLAFWIFRKQIAGVLIRHTFGLFRYVGGSAEHTAVG